MNSSPENAQKYKNIWIISILILASVGIFANTLGNEFVWDDKTLFVENYHRWQWSNIKSLVSCPDNLFVPNDNSSYSGFYRPLPTLTFLMDRYLWGKNAGYYHLFNIIFHTLSTIAVYLIAKSLLGNLYGAAIAGMMFAIHPIHTEAVAWINGRNNAIAGFFYFSAFYGYLRYRIRKKASALIFSLISFACSLFSKEYAFTFPIAMLLYEISLPSKPLRFGQFIARVGFQWLPYSGVILIYLILRSVLLPSHGAIPFYAETLGSRLLTVPRTTLLYLQQLIFPFNLNAFHDLSFISSLMDWSFLIQVFLFIFLIFLWIKSYGLSRSVFFGVGWILVSLLPVLNIIPLSKTALFFSERFLYIPSFGFCLLIGTLFSSHRIQAAWQKRPYRYLLVIFLLMVMEVHGFETLKRNLVWRNELTLWQDTVTKSPDSFKVRINLALALYAAGRLDQAYQQINEAIRIDPSHDTPYFILGVILFHKGDLERSVKALGKALQNNPNHIDASNLLTRIHMMHPEMGNLPARSPRWPPADQFKKP